MSDFAADLTALAEREPPDADAWEGVLVRAISSAASYADVEALCRAESVEEAFLGEGDPPTAAVVALVELAIRLGGREGARVVAFALRSAEVDVTTALAPGYAPTKPRVAAALGGLLPRIRELLGGAESEITPGLLMLLLRCPTVADDVAIPVQLLGRKKLAPAALLVGAVLAQRHRLPPKDPRREALLARARKDTKTVPAKHAAASDFATSCAASAALALGDTSDAILAAAEFALAAVSPLPEEWGWSFGTRALTCADVVVASLRQADASALDPAHLARLLRSMGGTPPPPPKTEPVESLATVVIDLGLRGTRTPAPLGLVLADVDEVAHAALEALATPRFEKAFVATRSVGFWSQASIRAFLSAEGPHYRVVEVEVGGRRARLHALRVWRGAAVAEIGHDVAMRALTEGASPDDVAELVFARTDRPITEAMLKSPEDWEREQALALALIEWLEARHPAWATAIEQRCGGAPVIAQFVTLALLRAASRGTLAVEPRHHRVIQAGFVAGRVLEPTLGWVRALPAVTASALLEKAGGIFKGKGAATD
jgi:hypothetical protein